ncbi:MAG: hypothetical protein GX358_04685 [candidate division WS1 bacterium]|jgi:hypothetical protein|nr:hypothetical protein [candidate division WS1 bacterium]
MRDNRRKVARSSRAPIDLFALLQGWSRTILQLSVIGFVIALGYILYGIFSGALTSMPPQQMARVAANLSLMGQLLALTGFLATVAVVLLTMEEIAFSVLMGILGAALMFGMPLLVAGNLADQASRPAKVINEWSRNAGMTMISVVGLRILWEIVIQLKYGTLGTRAERAEKTELAVEEKKWKKPGLWDRCWNMPYCHAAVREICPAYKARKSCWRFGYGCNCDPTLIETLIRTGGATTGKGSAKTSTERRTREAAYVRSDLEADAPVLGSQRTIPCTKCPIFIEHQRQKFRLINPIAVIATILAMVVLYKPLIGLYSAVIDVMARTAARLTYGSMVDPAEWIGYLNTPTVQVFFFLFVGMLALAYVLKGVEWAVLKKMIL